MDATQEQWRPVFGFEDSYEVSDQGRVRSVHRVIMRRNGVPKTIAAHVLSQFVVPPAGYQYVHLWRANKRTSKGVHVLVLEAFCGPRPSDMAACHNDGDATNNHAGNLRWDTRSENNYDIVRHGRHAQANKTHCLRGHLLSGDNLYINATSGSRTCRQCRRDKRAALQ